jgi:prepilin-type N-terminal cleavage/methylation domain-containing protein/prepilin-type processing-associated H-X9-DG protein
LLYKFPGIAYTIANKNDWFIMVNHYWPNNRLKTYRGFTLVELLVVVAIISILAAFIFPAVTASRQKAHTVKCMAQLRQWGQAFNDYIGNNEGNYPSNDWFKVVAPYAGATTNSSSIRPGDKSLFSCPSASVSEFGNSGLKISYAMNDLIHVSGRNTGNIGVETLRRSQLSKPSAFPVLFDSKLASALGNPGASTNDLTLRHSKSTANILFADGRVDNTSSSVSNRNVTFLWDPINAM